MVPSLSFAPTLVLLSPTLNRPPSALPPVALHGLLRSLLVLSAAWTVLNGLAGFLPAQLVFLVLPAAGVAMAHGVAQVTGVAITEVLEVQVVQVAQVVSAHGEPKPAASTATHGPPGLLDGDLSPLGLVPGLAAALPPLLLSLLPSPLPLPLAARLRSSLVPPSVSRLLLPPPAVALVTALSQSAVAASAPVVLWRLPSLSP